MTLHDKSNLLHLKTVDATAFTGFHFTHILVIRSIKNRYILILYLVKLLLGLLTIKLFKVNCSIVSKKIQKEIKKAMITYYLTKRYYFMTFYTKTTLALWPKELYKKTGKAKTIAPIIS